MSLSENATVSALVGAISGGGIAYIVSCALKRSDLKQGLAERVDDLYLDLKGEARSYWSRNGQDAAREDRLVALCVRSCDKIKAFEKKHNRSRRVDELVSLCRDLYIEVSGGTFAQLGRTADPQKVARIEMLVDRLRSYVEQ